MRYEIVWFDESGTVLATVQDEFDTLDSAMFVISKHLYNDEITGLDADTIGGISIKPVK